MNIIIKKALIRAFVSVMEAKFKNDRLIESAVEDPVLFDDGSKGGKLTKPPFSFEYKFPIIPSVKFSNVEPETRMDHLRFVNRAVLKQNIFIEHKR